MNFEKTKSPLEILVIRINQKDRREQEQKCNTFLVYLLRPTTYLIKYTYSFMLTHTHKYKKGWQEGEGLSLIPKENLFPNTLGHLVGKPTIK